MGHGGYKILTEVQSNLPSKYLCYLYSVRKCRSKVNIPLPSGCVFRRVNSESLSLVLEQFLAHKNALLTTVEYLTVPLELCFFLYPPQSP